MGLIFIEDDNYSTYFKAEKTIKEMSNTGNYTNKAMSIHLMAGIKLDPETVQQLEHLLELRTRLALEYGNVNPQMEKPAVESEIDNVNRMIKQLLVL